MSFLKTYTVAFYVGQPFEPVLVPFIATGAEDRSLGAVVSQPAPKDDRDDSKLWWATICFQACEGQCYSAEEYVYEPPKCLRCSLLLR